MSLQALIVAGPNGAGKSTLAYEFQEETGYAYYSADLLAAQIAPEDPLSARIEAGRRFFDEINVAIKKQNSLIVETTLSGRAFLGIFKRLKEAHYEIRIAYVFLDTPELCIRRVKQRMQKGGHDVPDVDIRRRFFRSKRNFWQLYRPLASSWYVYYNADETFEEIAHGDSTSETILDEPVFTLFKQNLITQ